MNVATPVATELAPGATEAWAALQELDTLGLERAQAPSSPEDERHAENEETAYAELLQAREDFGMARLRIGAWLCALSDSDAWRGKSSASTFWGFVHEEGIDTKAARQYMAVARRFILELGLTDDELRQIAMASMRVLDFARRVVDDTNKGRVIALVATLSRDDALKALADAMAAPDDLISADEAAEVAGGADARREYCNG